MTFGPYLETRPRTTVGLMSALVATQTIANSRPQKVFSQDLVECRCCGAHVRLGYSNGRNAAAWCTVCCTTSVYDIAPRTVAA